ncbi:Protein TOXD [Serendipita indica DSM 11827]|nr:Protein TOXD [Serendipita indica DSM 11827]
MSLPATHKALVVVEPGKVAVKEQPLPKYGDDELLVNVKAVALNPTDWKHIDNLLKPGQSIGCDFAGDVAAVGSNAQSKGFSVGDPVAGFIRGGFVVHDNGAFQGEYTHIPKYVAALPENIWHKPASLPYEDAAPMGGIALSTAVHAIHGTLNFPYESTDPQPILIWSGATGKFITRVGMYAIKIASLAGLKVVTTASEKNWELVKSLGADAVFDYKDPQVVQKIQQWAQSSGHGPLRAALDTISEHGSTNLCVEAVGQGGRVITLLPPPKEFDSKGAEVKTILVYTTLKPKNADDHRKMAEWYKKIPSYIESGKLYKGIVPLKVFHGFDQLPEAIDYVRQGKVSAQKLVVTLK